MLAFRTVTYCTENEETPSGVTASLANCRMLVSVSASWRDVRSISPNRNAGSDEGCMDGLMIDRFVTANDINITNGCVFIKGHPLRSLGNGRSATQLACVGPNAVRACGHARHIGKTPFYDSHMIVILITNMKLSR